MAPALFVVGAAPLLRADVQVFEAMIQGWSDQQLSRGLRADTINGRVLMLRRFQRYTNDWPWSWRPVDLDEFTAELRGEHKALPTIRAYQGSLRQFLDFVSDPRYRGRRPANGSSTPNRSRSALSGTPSTMSPTTEAAQPGDR